MKRSAALVKSAKASGLRLPSQLQRVPARLKKVGAALVVAKSKTARFIAKNPLRAVAGASAVGFVLAKLKKFG